MPYQNLLEDPRRRLPSTLPPPLTAAPVRKPQPHGPFLTDPATGRPYGPQAGFSPALQQFGQQMTGGLVGGPPLAPNLAQQPSSSIPGIQAAQAATQPQPALARPASFTDPAGNQRYFADPASATTAQGTLRSPQGLADLRNSILNRSFDPAKGPGTPAELAFAGVTSPGPTQPLDYTRAPALAAPVDVLRGTNVQRTGRNADASPVDSYRQALAENLQAGREMGADIRQYLPEIGFLSKAAPERAPAAPLTLSQQQAQRYSELARTGGALTPADVAFGPGRQGQQSKPTFLKETDQDLNEQTYLFDPATGTKRLVPTQETPGALAAPDLTQSPQAIAIHQAVRAGKLTREQAKAQLAKLRQQ